MSDAVTDTATREKPQEPKESPEAQEALGDAAPRSEGTTRTGVLRRLARGLSRPAPWRRGLLLTALALLLGLMLLLHAQLPDAAGLGSLVESVLPWCGLGVPVLLAAALWRRSASAVVALLLPVFAWVSLFGGLLTDKSRAGHDLVVAGHNVGADNPDPAGTARTLAASGADVLALEEMTPEARPTYERELAKTYPHHYTVGTVGLWSRLPLSDPRPVDIRQDVGPLGDAKPEEEKLRYARALRATVATEQGPLTVYVAHLGSVRVMPRSGFWSESRDRNAEALAAAVAADPSERVVLLGDLNGTMDDRAFDALTAQLRSVQEESGDGFGFTWPKSFPIARIDQILVKGVEPRSAWLLPETGSDHLPVAAGIGW